VRRGGVAIVIASVLLLTVSDARSQSSQPSQGRTEENHRETRTVEQGAHTGGTNQQGKGPPINPSIIVSTPSAPANKANAANAGNRAGDEAEHFKKEEALKKQANKLSAELVALTLVLAVVSSLVAAIYFVAMLATIRTANAAKESVTTAQKTLLTTQRPKLIVRNVVIRAPNPPAIRGGIELFQPRYEVNGQLYVVNVGGTVATTKECWCWGIAIKGELPMEPPYEGEMGYPLTQNLRPGESMPITFRNLNEIGPEGPLIRQGSDGWGFYVMGWIEYADDLDLIRRTAFCRKWDADMRRLIAIDNPDYEHAE
jgi:hypothetical protein